MGPRRIHNKVKAGPVPIHNQSTCPNVLAEISPSNIPRICPRANDDVQAIRNKNQWRSATSPQRVRNESATSPQR
eukprot:11161064-Lingulodinium_polyedra.AAC.1